LPVTIQARDLRAAIYRSAGASPSAILLSALFNQVYEALTGVDPRLNFRAAIDEAEAEIDEWSDSLVKHAYQNLIGPNLRRRRDAFSCAADQVLIFWDATQELCKWLAEMLWRLRERGDKELSSADSLQLDPRTVWEIRGPGWTDAVHLIGVAEQIRQTPDAKRWNLVALKTEAISPAADLELACLSRQALPAHANDKLVLVSFEPNRRESVFSETELAQALPNLKKLIGGIAGVSTINAIND
jgi:hypothetical protein